MSEPDESSCSEPGLRLDEVSDSEFEDRSEVAELTDASEEEEELEGAASAARRIHWRRTAQRRERLMRLC